MDILVIVGLVLSFISPVIGGGMVGKRYLH